jgi:hypothetical protein
MRSRSLFALIVLLGLGLGQQARAGGSVDWSDYLEPPGARTPVRATPTTAQRPAKAAAAPKKASRTVAKKSGSRNKAKKAAVRSKRRR